MTCGFKCSVMMEGCYRWQKLGWWLDSFVIASITFPLDWTYDVDVPLTQTSQILEKTFEFKVDTITLSISRKRSILLQSNQHWQGYANNDSCKYKHPQHYPQEMDQFLLVFKRKILRIEYNFEFDRLYQQTLPRKSASNASVVLAM